MAPAPGIEPDSRPGRIHQVTRADLGLPPFTAGSTRRVAASPRAARLIMRSIVVSAPAEAVPVTICIRAMEIAAPPRRDAQANRARWISVGHHRASTPHAAKATTAATATVATADAPRSERGLGPAYRRSR